MARDPALDTFSGQLPLFPLPNAVMFPGTRHPLHVFEPRYRQMVQDVMAGEKLIGVVLLKEGWEKNYFESPAIYQVACLCKLERVERLPDGRFNIRLQGLSRVRLGREIKSTPYRVCEVTLLEDSLSPVNAGALREHLGETLRIFDKLLREMAEFPGEVLLSRKHSNPGQLLDLLAAHLPLLAPTQKQGLLERVDVAERARELVNLLRDVQTDARAQQKMKLRLFPKPSQN